MTIDRDAGPGRPDGRPGVRATRAIRARRGARIAVAGAFAVGLGLAPAGCSSSGGSGSARADVRITGCVRDAGNHRAVATGEVRNHSSKRSNYVVQIKVKANDSEVENGFASVLRVPAGGRHGFTIRALGVDVPSGTKVTCAVSHVGRVVAP